MRQGVLAGQAAAHLGRVGGAAAQVGAESARASWGTAGAMRRAATGPSNCSVSSRWGSHLAHSQSAIRSPGTAERHGHVVGGVGDGGLDEQGARDAQDVLAVADDADVAGPVERDGEREFGAVC